MSRDPIDRLNAALTGRYDVERKLGEGGMATVYLGRDLRHDRPVAIKVLKSDLTALVGAGRFLTEIKTTAALQHPHILPLHDSGEVDGILFYVMPFVSGESLRERLDRERQLPVETAVDIATKVAEALDYAHRQGVIHRDIKPANILLQDGQPLLADFGIALAVTAGGGDRLTRTGLSIGTPNYMSPEQATGERTVGAPADVFALGCVLHEMLTGAPPFSAPTPQAVLARILSGSARPIREARRGVPLHVEAVVKRSLEPLAADRFATATDVVKALGNPGFRHGPTVAEASSARPWRGLFAGAMAVALLFAGLWASTLGAPERPAPVIRYVQDFPDGQELSEEGSRPVSLSPDGHLLVYPGPGQQLWIRPRDQLDGTAIAGTEDGLHAAFAPDGERIAFVTSRAELKVAALAGGPIRTVVDGNVWSDGIAWGPDGYLYFTLQPSLGLHRVRWDGDAPPEQLTDLDTDIPEVQHIWPDMLPGGDGLVFHVGTADGRSSVAVLDLGTRTYRTLSPGRRPRWSPSGHLLINTTDGSLAARPFDPERMAFTGPEVPVLADLDPNSGAIALSGTGRLAYRSGTARTRQVLWVERDGTETAVDSDWFGGGYPAVSPDGTRIAASGNGHVWIKNLDDGTLEQATFEGTNMRPAWTSDGAAFTFLSDRGEQGDYALYQRAADLRSPARLLFDLDEPIFQGTPSPAGTAWVLRVGVDDRDLYWAAEPGQLPLPLVATEARERALSFSPDGQWVAYVSDETGQDEVYVRRFPDDPDGHTRISLSGGIEPLWSNGGDELFYISGANELVSVQVTAEEEFIQGPQTVLFSTQRYGRDPNHRSYDISGDDQRFVMTRAVSRGGNGRLVIVENFTSELERLAPTN